MGSKEYREGFDDALDAMYDYLERLELKAKQCKELCVLMNMIGEWSKQNTYEQNIHFARDKIEEVRMRFMMTSSRYNYLNMGRKAY